jgi:hypothetical protein
MPNGDAISTLLATMTHQLAPLAIAWHVMLVLVLAAIVAGWRPSRRVAAVLLVTPVMSVGLVALIYGNVFNAASFLVLALLLGVLGDGLAPARAQLRGSWLGAALIAYGVVYPHFVAGAWYRALVMAPIGVVPCPTLALVCGVTLVAGGFSSRAIPLALGVWTAFYALFGVTVLGVGIDVGLLAGALGMFALLRTARTGDRHSSAARRPRLAS